MFFPVVLLQGPARFLFVPIALAVVIAMLASYVLSRTLVPTLARMMLVHEPLHDPEGHRRRRVRRDPAGHRPARSAGVSLARRSTTRGTATSRDSRRHTGGFVTLLIAHRWFTVGDVRARSSRAASACCP